jgi:hypothetical protein
MGEVLLMAIHSSMALRSAMRQWQFSDTANAARLQLKPAVMKLYYNNCTN